jgi:hypothetical protein
MLKISVFCSAFTPRAILSFDTSPLSLSFTCAEFTSVVCTWRSDCAWMQKTFFTMYWIDLLLLLERRSLIVDC